MNVEKYVVDPIPVNIKRKIGKNKISTIAICENKTLYFKGESTKRTGTIISYKVVDKTTVIVTYNRKVRQSGKGHKSKRLIFNSPPDLDHFLAGIDFLIKPTNVLSNNYKGTYPKIRFLIFTWNIGNVIPDETFYSFIHDTVEANSPQIVLFSGQESNQDDNFFSNFHKALGDSFVSLVNVPFWQIRLGIWASQSIQSAISDVFQSHEGTGVLNICGNKGAIGSTFKLFESPIAFIAAHFAAHQTHVQMRNDNYQKIVTSMNIDIKKPNDIFSSFHHIIWAGDLNYRINKSYDEVINAVNSGKEDLISLQHFDQLKIEQSRGNIFQDFSEGNITFNPTYKYEPNTSNYDKKSTRIPAWCDRVLIRSFQGLDKKCLQYSASDSVTTSDHHPVFAVWDLNLVGSFPPAPPFSSTIGIRPVIEFSNIIVNHPANSCYLTFSSSFLTDKDGYPIQLISAIGKGKKLVRFPDDTIPVLVPSVFIDITYMKALYLHIIVHLDENEYVAILPLKFLLGNVFREFSIPYGNYVQTSGNISGNLRLILANTTKILELKASHMNANNQHHFETRNSI